MWIVISQEVTFKDNYYLCGFITPVKFWLIVAQEEDVPFDFWVWDITNI